MTKSTTMDGLAKRRLVHSEPIENPPVEKPYDSLGRASAHVMDDFDEKLGKRDAKIAETRGRRRTPSRASRAR